jgi:glycerol-3-phosphate acyltransferase PlsY
VATIGGIALAAYLLGSIPAAYLVGRLAAGIDVRREGEGNVGARNVFHEVGPGWGLLVFALDAGKGAAVGLLFGSRPVSQLAVAAVFLIVGHAFPIWLGFVGGKGVAAAVGFGASLMPWAALIAGAVAAVAWALTRRFLPTLVPGAVVLFAAAPVTGVAASTIGAVLAAFGVVAAKRVLDEPRMRRIEAATGWDRNRGGSAR